MTTYSLAAGDVVYKANRAVVLDGVNLAFGAGEIVSLLGVNGAGKTTLLRIMLGLLRPTSGSVLLNKQPLETYKRREIARTIAYVPQLHIASFPYTVAQIVALGRVPYAGLGRQLSGSDHEVIEHVLDQLQISHLAARPYTELSGGERQRVLLARALAQQAPILVMDEPMTGLDLGHQTRMLMLLSDLAAHGYAILNTTHRPEDALQVSTRAILLEEGKIVADGSPQDVLNEGTISRLYDVPIKQVDIGNHRFFVPPQR